MRSAIVLSFTMLAACASAPPPPAVPPATSVTTTTSAEIAAPPAAPEPARIAQPPASDAAVFADPEESARAVVSSTEPDLLACYRRALRTNPAARGSPTFAIVVGPDGSVIDVAASGPRGLGAGALACMTARLRQAHFAAPAGGGTMHLTVPLSFEED